MKLFCIRYTFNDQCPHHIETSQLICSANQLTGFYMMETLVVTRLNKGTNRSLKEGLRGSFPILKDKLLLCYQKQGSLFILNKTHLYGFEEEGFKKMVCTFFPDGSLFFSNFI